MPAHQTVAEIENLHPLGVHDASRRADEASLVANYDDSVNTDDELVCLVLSKFKCLGDRLEVLLDFVATSPGTAQRTFADAAGIISRLSVQNFRSPARSPRSNASRMCLTVCRLSCSLIHESRPKTSQNAFGDGPLRCRSDFRQRKPLRLHGF